MKVVTDWAKAAWYDVAHTTPTETFKFWSALEDVLVRCMRNRTELPVQILDDRGEGLRQ
jgi:hypothetical protein